MAIIEVGAFGLPASKVGTVVQELGVVLVDRGYSDNTVSDFLEHLDPDDEEFLWERHLGPAADALEDLLLAYVRDTNDPILSEEGT